MTAPRKFGMIERFKRVARYRLHIPMMRSKQPATYVARGVMVGMMWAMTPFFGLHMAAVLLTWLLCRRLLQWDFSLVNGLAWTWTTNILTIIPAFYLFYLTGQVLTGNFSDPLAYEAFRSVFQAAGESGADDPASLGTRLSELWDAFGVPLFIGSALWTVVSGWISYRLALSFVISYREHRARRMEAAKQSRRSRRAQKEQSRRPERQNLAGNGPAFTAVSRRT